MNEMYQYSLEFFSRLFNRRLDKAAKSEVHDERINNLLGDITSSFYTNICRGLFEVDKLLYSFLNAASILRRGGEISLSEWNCYLRGSPTDFATFQNESEIISDVIFYKLLGLEESHFSFKDISKSFSDPGDCVTWKKILASEEPQTIPLPPLYEDRLNSFQKLMLIKTLRSEKLIHGVKAFVAAELGP